MNTASTGSLSTDTRKKFIGLIKHLNQSRTMHAKLNSNKKVELEQIKSIAKQINENNNSVRFKSSLLDLSPSVSSTSPENASSSNSSLFWQSKYFKLFILDSI